MNGQETTGEMRPALDNVAYPSSPLMKNLYKSPLLLWRMGLGPLLGRLFMILTTTGRKSGLARHTPLEFHRYAGRLQVMAAWPQSDWYQNLLADPHVTVQTAAGTQSMLARRVTSDAELTEMVDYVESRPNMRRFWEAMGLDITRESFIAEKERYHLVTFEPTDEPAPDPLPVDLWWAWFLLPAVWLLKWLVTHRPGAQAA